MLDKIKEFLKSLLCLSKIADKQKDDEMKTFKFNIEKYKFTIFCIYQSCTVNVWWGNNFNVFIFVFKDDKIDENEINAGKKLFNVIHLPPNLVTQELNKIGVKEL